jgi:hypothetical protein
MKKLFAAILVMVFAVGFAPELSAKSKGGSVKSSAKNPGTGRYSGGKGSSHKGGSYKRPSTNNHYKKR